MRVGNKALGVCVLALTAFMTLFAASCAKKSPVVEKPGGPRIAALSPGFSAMLRGLGRGDLMVARHAFDVWTDAAIPAAGDQAGVDYEALIAARPTHVLIQEGAAGVPERLASLARENGWQLMPLPLLSLDDVEQACGQVQAAFGVPGQPRIDGPLAARSVSPLFAGRVLLLYQGSPPTILGPGSYHHEILTRIGGTPAIIVGKAYMTLDAEDIRRLAPEGIVLIQPRVKGADSMSAAPDEPRKRLGVLAEIGLPAVAAGRVALIDDEMALVPGPNLRIVSEELAAILSRWAAEQR